MELMLGVLADPHLGRDTRFRGELRKVGSQSEAYTKAFVAAMETLAPDVVLLMGDAIQEDGVRVDDRGIYERELGLLAPLTQPFYAVAGNHDLISMMPEDLLATWASFPSMAAVIDVGGEQLYYQADLGPLLLVVLQTTEVKDSHIFLEAGQERWLEATLAAATKPVLIAVHHSLADQSTAGNVWFENAEHLCLVRDRARLRGILEASGKVIAVLNGHLHQNDCTVHGGIPYITMQSIVENVTGVEPPEPCGAWSTVVIGEGRLRVTVTGTDPATFDVPLGEVSSL